MRQTFGGVSLAYVTVVSVSVASHGRVPSCAAPSPGGSRGPCRALWLGEVWTPPPPSSFVEAAWQPTLEKQTRYSAQWALGNFYEAGK